LRNDISEDGPTRELIRGGLAAPPTGLAIFWPTGTHPTTPAFVWFCKSRYRAVIPAGASAIRDATREV